MAALGVRVATASAEDYGGGGCGGGGRGAAEEVEEVAAAATTTSIKKQKPSAVVHVRTPLKAMGHLQSMLATRRSLCAVVF